jgi:hypothetical protein
MTAAQARAYLAKANAAERTAYLRTLGLVQRFEALDSQDREAILGRQPRVGMSAEALRFLWGEPLYTTGHPTQSAHWYYRGSSFTLADRGNDRAGDADRCLSHRRAGCRVDLCSPLYLRMNGDRRVRPAYEEHRGTSVVMTADGTNQGRDGYGMVRQEYVATTHDVYA